MKSLTSATEIWLQIWKKIYIITPIDAAHVGSVSHLKLKSITYAIENQCGEPGRAKN